MFRNSEFLRALKGDAGVDVADLEHDTVFLIGMEAGPASSEWSVQETILDTLVKAFQPSPVLTHVELFIPPGCEKESEVTFATYVGRHAGWGASFPDSRDFYTGGVHSWRAIPVRASKIVQMVRMACKAEEGAPYSLLRYLTSVPPARAVASILTDKPHSPGHCATISTRILRRSGVHFPQSSAWYSPSTLYIELSKPSRAESYAREDETENHIKSLVETERTMTAVETLLRGSDDSVEAMIISDCQIAVDHLQKQVVTQRAMGIADTVREAVLERNLARALLRWAEVQNSKTATHT